MKTGWESRPIGELCQIRPPKSQARERLSPNAVVSFAGMEDLGIDRKFLQAKTKKQLSAVDGSYTYFANGDVLLAKITPCFENGKLGIADALENGVGFGSSEFIVLRPDARLDKEFLYYYLLRPDFRTEGAARMGGAVGQQRVPKDFIEKYPIPLPPIQEQRSIVAILDKAFAAIATAKANTEKNLLNARAPFQLQLDTLLRLQNGDSQVRRLGDVCVFINGRAYSKGELLERGKYLVLRVGNFFTNDHWYYSDLELDPDKYCDSGDLLYAWSASFGPRIWMGPKVIYHYHIWKVVPNTEIVSKEFLKYLLEWDVQQVKQAHGTGTTMMHVGKASMENRRLPIPPIAEQREIVNSLDQLNQLAVELQSSYKQKLTALEDLKRSILSRAFSGNL